MFASDLKSDKNSGTFLWIHVLDFDLKFSAKELKVLDGFFL